MAASIDRMLIALLVAFAVVAASAARDGAGAASKAAAAAHAPSPSGEAALHPTATYDIPDLPLPRILPCPPWFPKIPFIPCRNVTQPAPAPTECRPSLAKLMPPCTGFLTDDDSLVSKDCCDGVGLFLGGGNPSAYDPLCLCHLMNDDVKQLVAAPVNHTRALSVLEACGYGIPPRTVLGICNDDTLSVPPMDLPEPPTPAPAGNRA